MKKIFAMLLLACSNLSAQRVYDPASSPYLETVAATPSFTDAFACSEDPAALPQLNGFAAGAYFEKKYLIQGLGFAALSVAYGRKSGGAGLSVKYFGNVAYNETHASLNYAKSLGNINIAASFDYNGYAIAGIVKLKVFSFGFHSLMKLSDKVFTSVQVINPPFSRFSGSTIRQTGEYRLGFFYEPSATVCISFELAKREDIPLQVRSALQYRPGQKFYSKIGVASAGPQPFIGLGWTMKNFQAQVSIGYHPSLGITPGTLLSYQKPFNLDLQ